MDDVESVTSSPNSRKRAAPGDDGPTKKLLNLHGSQFMPTPPDTDESSKDARARQGSPAPSSSALSSTVEITGSNVIQGTPGATPGTSSSTRPAKRRKLTPAEKEQQKREKEAKDAERAIKKAEREEEKRLKDEEKRKKAEEREEKKREKELEEERKAREKLKKERAQMRLGAFFQKPATPVQQSEDGGSLSTTARRKSLSLEPFDAVADQLRVSQSPCKGAVTPVASKKTPAKPTLSDYERHFLPFELKQHCSLANVDRPDDLEAAQAAFDHELFDPLLQETYDLGIVDSYASLEQFSSSTSRHNHGQPLPSTRQLVDQIQGSLRQPVDLSSDETPDNPVLALQELQQRYIEFDVDVRPPYFGTYSKIRSPRTVKKLGRKPSTRARPDTDYDYDSEAEWEEPDEGDDECVEDEDEADSQGDVNEMDEFLDDEEDALKSKRKIITGDLVPASTGLCWEDPAGRQVSAIDNVSTLFMRDMRIGVLLPAFSDSTIDPFSTKYWDKAASTPALVMKVESSAAQPFGTMAPPRPPLQPRTNTNGTLDHVLVGAAEGMKGPITSLAGSQAPKSKPKAPPKTLSKEDLDEFKDAVVGSPLNRADMLKGLKSRFPKITNDTIKATLLEHFAQLGASKAEKKWVFVDAP